MQDVYVQKEKATVMIRVEMNAHQAIIVIQTLIHFQQIIAAAMAIAGEAAHACLTAKVIATQRAITAIDIGIIHAITVKA